MLRENYLYVDGDPYVRVGSCMFYFWMDFDVCTLMPTDIYALNGLMAPALGYVPKIT